VSAEDDDSGAVRFIFGRPRLWVAAVWLALGAAWFVLAAIEGPTWLRLLCGTFWSVGGIVYGIVAVRDRARGLGAYRRR